MHTYSDLREAVIQERRRQGLTLEDLAQRSGLPFTTVQRYCGKSGWGGRYDVYLTLAHALDMDLSVTHGKPTPQAVAA